MGVKKQYADVEVYEKKLHRVMERFEVDSFNFEWSRSGAWIEFTLKGQLYRFDHSVERAKARGFDLRYGSDVFAQLVITLEDLARMGERGIYELQTWLAGMKYLPPPVQIPACFAALGFEHIPASAEDVKARFKTLAKQQHPDSGGSDAGFIQLRNNADAAIKYMEGLT